MGNGKSKHLPIVGFLERIFETIVIFYNSGRTQYLLFFFYFGAQPHKLTAFIATVDFTEDFTVYK